MGLFSKLFKKNIRIDITTKSSSFSNPKCLKLWNLKKYIDILLSENRYVPKSEYRNKLLEEKKTIEYFAVLDNSGMLKSFCSSNKIDIADVEAILNCYRNFESLIDAHNEEYIQSAMKSEKTYLDNILRDIDPNIKLDDDQRRVILTDEDYCLVIAGAGALKRLENPKDWIEWSNACKNPENVPQGLVPATQYIFGGNEGSRRTILKNGGVYESTVYEANEDIYLERY